MLIFLDVLICCLYIFFGELFVHIFSSLLLSFLIIEFCEFFMYSQEKEMATHSSVPAWKIPGMGEPGGLPSVLSHRVGHDWSDAAAAACILNTSTLLDKKFKIFSLSLWLVFFFFSFPVFQRPNIFNFNDLINHIFLVCTVYLRSWLSTQGLTWDVEDFLLQFYILHLRLWSILNQCLHKMYNMY